ncbi:MULTISPECIES: TatD family hydrolase [unclassified Mycoplasma]|uniref:TatD family hydrolase n=1 Tax=unclassified Mycoplasma TaxID=2683645 RepID=UPI00211CAC11|nr:MULTISPECIES: TatD family hydrolase [unclassified Mycoplasma]UUM19855.1 TatD family hydrolase [Mycoplasma sp. 1578d]UUM24839.1 TatD family hydrolase [Mycoplasma sp. 3686d]
MSKKKNKFVDAHNHLTNKYYPDWVIDEIIAQAQVHNIEFMIVNGGHREENYKVLELAKKHSIIKPAVGIHPEDLHNISDIELIKPLLKNDIVAIGEIGLDYFYDNVASHELQKQAFEEQVIIAKEHNLPVIVHIRDKKGSWKAYEDVFNILEKYKVKAMLHTFAGNLDWAKKFEKLDCYFSFSGIVTYGSASDTREVVEYLPINKILTETDSPYLRVHPYTGQTNEPNTVLFVAYYIAGLKKVGMDKFVNRVNQNLRELFKLK